MAKRKFSNQLINEKDIQEEIKLIDGSNVDFISENGNIYSLYDPTNKKYFKKKLVEHESGYLYCGIILNNGKRTTKRVHKLVALAFVENQNPLKNNIVGHQDNNKKNNRKDNLYWTTISENTQKAFDDGLIKNDKGYEDSQSTPVAAFKTDGTFVGFYGSTKECAKLLGVSASTVQRQCKGVFKGKSRCGYNFRFQTEDEIKINKKYN